MPSPLKSGIINQPICIKPPMTPQKESGKEGLNILLMLACFIIITAGLHAGKQVLLPIVLSGFLAIVSYPLTSFFKGRLKFPHWLAVMFTVIMDFGVLVGLGYLAQYLGRDLAQTITDKYHPLLMAKIQELRHFLIAQDWNNMADQMLQEIPELLNGQRIVAFSTGLMGQLASMLTFTTLILILMTFFLGEAPRFHRNINQLGHHNDNGIRRFSNALCGVQKYLIIKTFISAVTGFLAFLLCYYIKVDFPLLWGIAAFALNFIPTFGSIIAAIPPTLLALLLISPTAGIIVAVGYLVINTALGNCLEPMLMGKQFGIVTSMVLLSVIFWGWVWGPIGMLLAVPITMLIKLGLESSKDLAWIAQLIDNPPTPRFPIHPLHSGKNDDSSNKE